MYLVHGNFCSYFAGDLVQRATSDKRKARETEIRHYFDSGHVESVINYKYNKFVYALHAYFLIGLRCPSGNNKRAMGVTDDSEVPSSMEQERTSSIAPSSFAPSPL